MRNVTFAASQFAAGADNLARAESLVREAASQGANVILIQELFASLYFCQDQKAEHFAMAQPFEGHPVIALMAKLAKELDIVLPVSFFERAGQAHFNSLAMVDAGGEVLGLYRKSHIPDGPGYQEKFYFNPGDTGFKSWSTRHGRIGVGVCWDQWFPEAARAMTLLGSELILCPTTIGNEVGSQAGNDTSEMWRRAMDAHAVCNHVPVAAANRIGTEGDLTFYGSSFVVDHRGRPLAEAGRDTEETIFAELDLVQARSDRAGWGLLRDRRPDLYGALTEYHG